MKAKIIAIKNITTNTLLVGTQLEWNMWLQVNYILESPTMVMQALRKQYPEYEDFIVQEPLNVVSFKPQGEKNKRFTPSRKKGFVIKEHARKSY